VVQLYDFEIEQLLTKVKRILLQAAMIYQRGYLETELAGIVAHTL